jgi:hypothetical protein
MLPTARTRLALALALALAGLVWVPAQSAQAQAQKNKANFKRVTIKTGDGVELQGYFYPSPGGKKEATALLLHHFDPKKGGSSQSDGLPKLAERLQKEGYSLLAFDFRGFGDSKTVGKEFWDFRRNSHNQLARRNVKFGKALPESIEHTQFAPGYYPYLANDIAAAKAFLDRRNDAGELNSSNVVVIGAGEGATVGALWLESMCYLHRDKNPMGLRPELSPDPEVKDIVCAVWLSIQPTLAGARYPVTRWLTTAGGRNFKVPMAFIYGGNDRKSESFAETALKGIKSGARGKLEYTGKKAISGTELSGAALIGRGAEKFILDKYIAPVLEKRGTKESVKRRVDMQRLYYQFGLRLTLAKQPGDDVPRVLVPLFLR